ncbi:hypothetical protein ACIBKY_50765 [Nonomuraea sp. NPDC050394]|uniref:hypothetical protein n=1 Tax=Nonomuraea sp. NPDC050394 TaxID=3364363 RepID=UPI0037B5087F
MVMQGLSGPQAMTTLAARRSTRPRPRGAAFDKSSITQRAALDFAVALGENRFKFHLMSDRQAALLTAAAVRALDLPVPAVIRIDRT